MGSEVRPCPPKLLISWQAHLTAARVPGLARVSAALSWEAKGYCTGVPMYFKAAAWSLHVGHYSCQCPQ